MPSIMLTLITIRPLSDINFNQRRRNQPRRRRQRRIHRRARFPLVNNQDMLTQIINLPPQATNNDPLIDQFFNGNPFY